MMFGFKELMLISLAFGQTISRSTDYCYAENDQPYLKFGTKTAYTFIHGGKRPAQNIPGCKPLQIWMLMRPGTLYPDADTISKLKALPKLRDQITYNHDTLGNGHLCDLDLENLRMWLIDSSMTIEKAENLVPQGTEDLMLLAKRLKSHLPELFPSTANNVVERNYKFRSTGGEKTSSSLTAFMTGLFDQWQMPPTESPMNDTQFASHQSCPEWRDEVSNNPEAMIEVTRFKTSPEYQDLLMNVSRRLGFRTNITEASLNAMYDMCRYEKAWNLESLSVWCAVFSTEELKVLEYRDDLTQYYKYGYGNKVNLRMGCSPLQDMFRQFKKLESGDNETEPKGVFSVAELGTLELFITAMRFAEDSTPLLASNYQTMSKRLWRTSEIGSFAANIQAVFYRCDVPDYPNKVIFYMGEKPVPYTGCKVGLCEWDDLKNRFAKTLSDCESNFCYGNSAFSSLVAMPVVLLWLGLPAIAFFAH